jgi:hypothetical protein
MRSASLLMWTSGRVGQAIADLPPRPITPSCSAKAIEKRSFAKNSTVILTKFTCGT